MPYQYWYHQVRVDQTSCQTSFFAGSALRKERMELTSHQRSGGMTDITARVLAQLSTARPRSSSAATTSCVTALLNSGTASAPSSAAVSSTPACHQGLPALPPHAPSAAALLHSSIPSTLSNAALPYVAAWCCTERRRALACYTPAWCEMYHAVRRTNKAV